MFLTILIKRFHFITFYKFPKKEINFSIKTSLFSKNIAKNYLKT